MDRSKLNVITKHKCPVALMTFQKYFLAFGPFSFFFFSPFYLLIYLFLTARGLRCCAQTFSSCGYSGFLSQWLLLLWSKGSRLEGHSDCERGLSSFGSQALEPKLSSCGVWA